MKKSILTTATLAVALLAVTSSCRSKKSISQVSGSKEISLPFEEDKYKSDKSTFRAKSMGKSPDLATAKKIARLNAQSEMASNIESVIKGVAEQYTNQRGLVGKTDFEQKFEENVRLVTNQSLTDVREIGGKVFQEEDGSFTYWVSIEMSKDAVEAKLAKRLNEDEKLKLDFDQHQFKKTFDEEMDKFKNGK